VAEDLQLLRLLHIASPALPVGAFHFSQGMEHAVEAGWITDEASALEWIGGLAEGMVERLDLPMLARLHDAWSRQDRMAVRSWNSLLIAMRETSESRAEDLHMGAALSKVLIDLELPGAPPEMQGEAFSYAAVFARACACWSIPANETLQSFAWAWAETQVLAAIKLVPLGQRSGQRILHALIPVLAAGVQRALALPDEEIGIRGVMQAFASASHETQYTRLFRS
jgi:urease accessory protein